MLLVCFTSLSFSVVPVFISSFCNCSFDFVIVVIDVVVVVVVVVVVAVLLLLLVGGAVDLECYFYLIPSYESNHT